MGREVLVFPCALGQLAEERLDHFQRLTVRGGGGGGG